MAEALKKELAQETARENEADELLDKHSQDILSIIKKYQKKLS